MIAITPIKTERDEWAEEAITQLENALKRAKENPQESVAILMLSRDRNIEMFYSTMDRTSLIGHLETIKINIGKFQ